MVITSGDLPGRQPATGIGNIGKLTKQAAMRQRLIQGLRTSKKPKRKRKR